MVSQRGMKVLLTFAGLILVAFFLVGIFFEEEYVAKTNFIYEDNDLKKFQSQEEFDSFVERTLELNENARYDYGRGDFDIGLPVMNVLEGARMTSGMADGVALATKSESFDGGASDYSETNIQVEGVDEADIVKNDDRYIYVVSGEKIVIVNAFPVNDLEVLGEIEFDRGYIDEIFINEDKLIVFGRGLVGLENSDEPRICGEGEVGCDGDLMIKSMPEPDYSSDPEVLVYDIRDRSRPVLENDYSFDGNYIDSRMIGEHVYIISNKYLRLDYPDFPVFSHNGIERSADALGMYYPPYPDNSYQFTNIMAIDLVSGEMNVETFLLGASYNPYVSEDHIYLTQQKSWEYDNYLVDLVNEVYLKVLPSEYDEKIEEVMDMNLSFYEKANKMDKIVREYSESLDGSALADFSRNFEDHLEKFEISMTKKERTAVYKIRVDDLDIEYLASGEVPGRLLNQFSMDEFEGNLRLATTTGNMWDDTSLNHMYVMNEDLEIIGSVEDLAKGESIYSARFMGKRAYMVTFRQTDPLFSIDLSDPENPQMMGYLKITGFSNYLHPYDDNHLIGIGREADENGGVESLKVVIFDVSDIENPTESAKVLLGGIGTHSEALYEHKAVLFDREKGILVLPVSDYNGRFVKGYTWKGVYVLDVDTDEISIRGNVSHYTLEDLDAHRWNQHDIRRSLYLDDVLYTVSRNKVKANWLGGLGDIREIEINEPEEYPTYYGRGFVGELMVD